MRIGDAIRRIERDRRLDRVVDFYRSILDRMPSGPVKDTLHGVQLGHPLHPLLVQIPIGAWTSATVLDLFPGTERAARRLVDLGLVSALPAMVAGAADWSDQHERHQRVGVVHAAANNTGWALFAASALARHRGRHGWGRALGLAGMGMVGVGGMLGAHIAYNLAGGPNHADQDRDLLPEGWQDIGPVADFPEGEPVRAMLGTVPVVVVRTGGDTVRVLTDTCAHLGGPLSEGETDGECITCPWHGSTFRLDDGTVVRGPATAQQPALQVRVSNGTVRVRRPDEDADVPRPRGEHSDAGAAAATRG
jgi:nitrite reductase/ring-hydroxylating ferredoxin subunit/uncharacterized membrane protein